MSMLIHYLVNFPTEDSKACRVQFSSSFHNLYCPFPYPKVDCSGCIFGVNPEAKHKAIDVLGKLGELV